MDNNRVFHACFLCGVTFSTVHALNGHMKAHRAEKNKAMHDLIMNRDQHQANQQVNDPSQRREEVDLELRLGTTKVE